MYILHFTLFSVLISSLPIAHLRVLPLRGVVNQQDIPTHALESKSDAPKSYSILPLVQIKYFKRFVPPTNIDFSTWKKGDKFLTAETKFSGSIPGVQTFLCGRDDITSKNPQDEYCSFPVHFEQSDILRCKQEPKPFVEKYLIKNSTESLSVRCGENENGELYSFVYKICTLKNMTEEENEKKNSDTKWDPIDIRSEFVSYRFCYDWNQRQLLYTRHKLQSIDLLSDKKLKQERQISYDIITDGYDYFGSWFEKVEQRYVQLKKYGYEPVKLVPSNHFPLASWKKPTYHFLNTMPMRKKLIRLWEHIFNLIRRDGIQNKRQYEFHTRTLSIENQVESIKEIQPPDIWITIVKYVQRENGEDIDVALAIIMNNKFEKTTNSVTGYITQTYSCVKNLCENAFSEKFSDLGKSVHCCAVNDAIKLLFEENMIAEDTLKPDFLFDSAKNAPEPDQVKTLARKPSTVAGELTKLISKAWKREPIHTFPAITYQVE